MTRTAYILLSLLAGFFSARAQSISKAEYYFDNDPGTGKGTALTFTAAGAISASFNLATTGLQPGMHKLFLRFGFSTGEWGPSADQIFFIDKDTLSAKAKVNAIEAFFDNDPGNGKGMRVTYPAGTPDNTPVNGSLSTASLSTGWHKVFARASLNNGFWGPVSSGFFMVQKPYFTEPASGIAKIEFAIDADTPLGKKNNIPFSPVLVDSVVKTAAYNVMSLNTGQHTITVRAQNGYGVWSRDSTRPFTVQNGVGIQGISQELNNIIMYPNPAKEILNIEGRFENLQLTDITGKELQDIRSGRDQDFHTIQLDLLPRGVYILRISAGDAAIARKLIKE